MDVSLLSSRRPGSADEPQRTLFSIVAENLSLAASTAGDPSSCAIHLCQQEPHARVHGALLLGDV